MIRRISFILAIYVLFIAGSLSAQQNGDLIIDNKGIVSTGVSTPLPNTITTFDNITVFGRASAQLPGTVTVTNRLQINSSAEFRATRVVLSSVTGLAMSGGTYRGILEGSDLLFTGPGSINIDGEIIASSLNISGGTTLSHPASTTTTEPKLKITLTGALSLSLDSLIDASAKGYIGGSTVLVSNVLIHTWPHTIGNTQVILPKKGGSYGGIGGDHANATPVYGRFELPFDLGTGGSEPGLFTSGSGEIGARGGAGGGRVWIVADTITLDGSILANGANGSGGFHQNGQGGSGGSILIQTNGISGNGKLQSNGGQAGGTVADANAFGGGAGGRIALYYGTRTGVTIEAKGNVGDNFQDPIPYNAGAGTVYLKDAASANGDLVINNGGLDTNNNEIISTPLFSIGTGTSTSLSANQLTDTVRTFVSGSLLGIELRPDITKPNTFTVIGNDDHNIFTDPPDGDMTAIASSGASYIGQRNFRNVTAVGRARAESLDQAMLTGTLGAGGFADLRIPQVTFTDQSAPNLLSTGGSTAQGTFRGNIKAFDVQTTGATVEVDGEIAARSLTLTNASTLSHPVGSASFEPKLKITLSGALTVPFGTKIDVSGKGYPGGFLSGTIQSAVPVGPRTFGNIAINLPLKGGSYGGLGGDRTNSNPVYGRIDMPFELGTGGSEPGIFASGSGEFGAKGGPGGGRVWITADTIMVNGQILANGANGSTGFHLNGQGGSGGSILLQANSISGSSLIQANGGQAGDTVHDSNTFGGGSGGRIAAHYNALSGITFQAKGNLGDNILTPIPYNGGAGTVYLKENLAAQGDLIVDNGNIDTNSGDFSTPIPAVGPGTSTALSANVLTDSIRTFLANRLTGIELRPNAANTATYTVTANDAHTITTDPGDGELTQFAVTGISYIGQLTFRNVTVQGKARVKSFDDLYILGIKTVTTGSVLVANNNP